MVRLLFLFLPLAVLSLGCDQNDESQFEIDLAMIEAYLAENQLTAQQDGSGLYYIIEEPGSGGSPNINSEVQVRYKGYLLDGSVFDQTQGSDTAFLFLRSVIRGWQIGLPLLKRGGKGTFLIPSGLAYGGSSRPGIPPNSVLIFEIELVNFQ